MNFYDSLITISLPDSVSELVTSEALANYTVEGANKSVRSALRDFTPAELFPGGVSDQDMAACCVSGLWLLHNFLDDSHEISQSIHSPEGSYWHGIMHRLEGDFWNSKYWYRKVGDHPVFESIGNNWDPYEFVDACESAERGSDEDVANVQRIAAQEWAALFEYCFEQAS